MHRKGVRGQVRRTRRSVFHKAHSATSRARASSRFFNSDHYSCHVANAEGPRVTDTGKAACHGFRRLGGGKGWRDSRLMGSVDWRRYRRGRARSGGGGRDELKLVAGGGCKAFGAGDDFLGRDCGGRNVFAEIAA